MHGAIDHKHGTWLKMRDHLREPFAEFLGVCILVIFGTGVNCQVVLSSDLNVAPSPRGSFISINFGWATGVAMGVWIAGGISGAHINPAVTLAMAIFRGFPRRKVPVYILSQVLGGIIGAAVIYGTYFHAIDVFEGQGVRTLKTAELFSTYALDYMTFLPILTEYRCTEMQCRLVPVNLPSFAGLENPLPPSLGPVYCSASKHAFFGHLDMHDSHPLATGLLRKFSKPMVLTKIRRLCLGSNKDINEVLIDFVWYYRPSNDKHYA